MKNLIQIITKIRSTHLLIFNTKKAKNKMEKSDFKLFKKQNEFLYELKNLLWLNFCNQDFEGISKDSKSYQFRLDKIKSKPLLVVKSDPTIDFEPFKQLKNESRSQLSVSINDIEQVLNAVNNVLEKNKNSLS